jgi:fumarylpyruvate hydrolase
VIGPWINVATFSDYVDTDFSFELDGVVKQRGAARQMTYSITESLRYLKENFRLIPGDVIFTGTPKGVGPVTAGQIGRLRWGDKLSYEVLFT